VNNNVTAFDTALQNEPDRQISADVTRRVENQEKLERIVPQAVYLVIGGLFLIIAFSNWSRDALGVIIYGVVIVVLAKFIVRGVRGLILEPSRRIRYDRSTDQLRSYLQRTWDVAAGPYSWTLGAPGAMALSRTGELIVIDRSHGYVPLRLLPQQIADVHVECNSQQFIHTVHSGRTTIAGFGKSFGLGYTMGGNSTSVASTVSEYFLEIRYQLEKNGAVGTVIVPGGPERRVVEELCATIRRLEEC
jgi:hypothetical protein